MTAGEVRVVGTTITTPIRSDGKFTLSAPRGTVTLQARSLGYSAKTLRVPANQSTVTFALSPGNVRLQAVVTTGLASGIEQKNVATSIATVGASELARMPPVASIDQALEGQVVGAHVTENSGAPGGGTIVRMRGVTSLIGAFSPLYVVDGVIVSDVQLSTGTNAITQANGNALAPQADNQDNSANRIADLNPDDIASVEVLKGASASAIYGSKASNGVILITTKRGQVGPPQFDITEQLGVSELSHKFGVRCFTLDQAVASFGALAATNWTPNCYDTEQELYGGKPGSMETDLGMQGGSASTRYFASVLVKHDGGIIRGSFADKRALRLNINQTIGSRATFSINTDLINSERDPKLTQNENNGLAIPSALAYGGTTWLNLQQLADGTYPRNPFNANNPFQTVALFQNLESVWRGIVSGRLQVQLLTTERQSLRLLVNGGGDFFTQQNKVLAPPELYVLEGTGLPGSSALLYAQNANTNLNTNLIDTYHLPGGGTATTQLGMQSESVDLNTSQELTQGLIAGLSNAGAGLAVRVGQYRQRVRDQGFFAQEEVLLFNERLLLTLGGRADRSTNNADPAKLFFYPKASVSYRMPHLPALVDEFKLRLAFGESGNEPLYGQKFTELTSSNLGGLVPMSRIGGSAGAPDLHPEREREIETGFDATLLHNRANVSATVYDKAITDLLLQRTLVPSTGLSQLVFNGGSMRNRGVELSAGVIPVQGPRWTWSTDGSIYGNRCIIQSLAVPAFAPVSFLNDRVFGETFIEPGKSCTQIVGNDTLGAEKGDAALGPLGSSVVRPIADATPAYNWSWTNDIRYKLFHLTALLGGQKGGVLLNVTQLEYDASQTSPDYSTPRKPGQLTGEQRLAAWANTARVYVQDVSYVKVREVTLSADLPPSMVRRVWAQARSAQVRLSARNLFTFTNYNSTGDPEVNQVSKSAAGGIPWDLWAYPPSRTLTLSVHLGF